MFVTCLPPRYSPQIDTNEKSCSFAFGTFRSISQLKIGIKSHNAVLHVPFSVSLLFLLVLSHNVFFFKKNKSRKEKSNKKQTTNWSDRRGGGSSLECRGWMKKSHTASLHDYFSDSWLVRFWQFLAYFSNKDYRNHYVLSETTRTKSGTRRLNFFFFLLGKLLNVDVYFHLWTRRTRKVQGKVHPRCTFSSPMPGKKASIKSLLIF